MSAPTRSFFIGCSRPSKKFDMTDMSPRTTVDFVIESSSSVRKSSATISASVPAPSQPMSSTPTWFSSRLWRGGCGTEKTLSAYESRSGRSSSPKWLARYATAESVRSPRSTHASPNGEFTAIRRLARGADMLFQTSSTS